MYFSLLLCLTIFLTNSLISDVTVPKLCRYLHPLQTRNRYLLFFLFYLLRLRTLHICFIGTIPELMPRLQTGFITWLQTCNIFWIGILTFRQTLRFSVTYFKFLYFIEIVHSLRSKILYFTLKYLWSVKKTKEQQM